MRCSFGLFCFAILSGVLLPVQSVDAVVINASSNGYGLFVDVSALGLNLDAGPFPNGAIGVAPAPYNVADSSLGVNVTGISRSS